MKRYSLSVLSFLATIAVLAVDAAPVRAEARPITSDFDSTSLKAYLASKGETAFVSFGQAVDSQRWRTTSSANSAMTLMIELAVNPAGNSLGVYNAADPVSPLFEIFPASAPAGHFAMASFRTGPDRLIVTLFDFDGNIVSGPTPRLGVSIDNFGFYIKNSSDGVGYSQDARNADEARVLAIRGTDKNAGNWWLCFEDGDPFDQAPERDFDDAVLFVESINPTAVSRTSWGALKSRFR